MIAKINQLKSKVDIAEVKTLCESTIGAISSAIYKGVTNDARLEMERVALSNLFEGLEEYTENKVIKEWLVNQKRIYALRHLGVRKAVNSLLEKEAKFDDTLRGILEGFREKLEENVPEVLIYEQFISAMSGFNHLPAIHTELEAISNRVDNYKNDVDITKILETMKDTRSNYLIPLIEDVVNNYLNDKTAQTKSHLKETLVKFSYDPFIRDIINILTLDATDLQLEYANSNCNIEDKIFSPIIYLGENEALFNIKNSYYIKKGNNINRLKEEDVKKIDESFKNLCSLINLPNVEVSKEDIKVYIGKNNAILTESETIVNGKTFTEEQLNESKELSKLNGTKGFFDTVNILRENFEELAEIDFVKRVELKENENYAADVFKLRDNIFITTFDPINDKNTFYRNINPIQAEKVMMEHMRFDISKTFKEILPSKEKILAEIDETKKEYSDYIKELEEKINKVSSHYITNETSKAVIDALKEELEAVKKDYKEYLNEVESFVDVSENLNITVQDDTTGKSYTVVVPTGAMAAKGEDGKGEGDEFGTEVGRSDIDAEGPSSAITFDDDESELLSDEPTLDRDEVDMGADEIEAYADKVDAEAELEEPEEPEIGEEIPGEEGGEEVEDVEDLGGEEGEETAELDINLGEKPKDEEDEEEKEKKEEAAGPPNEDEKDKEIKKTKKVYLKRPKK